jgi:hypothetical protein
LGNLGKVDELLDDYLSFLTISRGTVMRCLFGTCSVAVALLGFTGQAQADYISDGLGSVGTNNSAKVIQLSGSSKAENSGKQGGLSSGESSTAGKLLLSNGVTASEILLGRSGRQSYLSTGSSAHQASNANGMASGWTTAQIAGPGQGPSGPSGPGGVVPAPSSAILMGLGGLVLVAFMARSRKHSSVAAIVS